MRAIGPCNRVGDVEHASCRVANASVKRVNERLKDLIENGAPDVAELQGTQAKLWFWSFISFWMR